MPNGMLEQATGGAAPPQQGSVPGQQTPPPGGLTAGAAPGAGQPQDPATEMSERAVAQAMDMEEGQANIDMGGDETLPDWTQLRDEAIRLVYGERFETMVKMFQSNGAERFPQSMSTAINTAIDELELAYESDIPYDDAARIGLALYMRLLEDMIGEGIVPDVSVEQIQETLPAVLMGYRNSHPEVTQQDLQTVMLEAHKGITDNARSGTFVPGVDKPDSLQKGADAGGAAESEITRNEQEAKQQEALI